MNLAQTLDRLENAQLVRPLAEPERAYVFRHTLTQDTAYESLLHAQRREIHRAVAEAYESTYGGERCADEFAAILARHYAGAGDAERTLVYATHAGDAAARLYAHPEAIAFYAQALDAAKRTDAAAAQFTHLYAARGRAYELAADYARAIENYVEMQALAQTRGDRAMELEAVMAQATAYAVGSGGVGDPRKAEDLSRQALALAEGLGDRAAQARIYWILLLIFSSSTEDPPKAVAYGEKSLALARELGLTEQIALTLKDLFAAYMRSGKADRAWANIPEAVALWRQLNNTPMLAEALLASLGHALLQGRLGESIQVGEEAHRLCESIGNRDGMSTVSAFLWFPYRERGQMNRAFELAEQALSIAEEMKVTRPHWVAAVPVELAATFDWLGDYARATGYARQVLDRVNPNLADHPVYPRSALASIALHQGSPAQAAGWLAPVSDKERDEYSLINFADGVQVYTAPMELALAQKEPDHALAIADHAIDMLRKKGMVIALPTILHLQARALRMLGRVDEAYAMLIDARERAEAMQSRYRLLPILFTLLEWQTDRGDEAQVEVVRRQAREVIDYVAAHLPPEELRASFLNLPNVRKVMNM